LQTQSSQGHEAELRRLGQKIVDCCRDAGLTVQWTGDAEDMIVIKVALTVMSSHQTASSRSCCHLAYISASMHVCIHALYNRAYTWQIQGGVWVLVEGPAAISHDFVLLSSTQAQSVY